MVVDDNNPTVLKLRISQISRKIRVGQFGVLRRGPKMFVGKRGKLARDADRI